VADQEDLKRLPHRVEHDDQGCQRVGPPPALRSSGALSGRRHRQAQARAAARPLTKRRAAALVAAAEFTLKIRLGRLALPADAG
jgi:hypothetical protein